MQIKSRKEGDIRGAEKAGGGEGGGGRAKIATRQRRNDVSRDAIGCLEANDIAPSRWEMLWGDAIQPTLHPDGFRHGHGRGGGKRIKRLHEQIRYRGGESTVGRTDQRG